MNMTPSGMVSGYGGAKVAYKVEGTEGAPWLVLSNSLATDWRVWDPQMEILRTKYRILRYDTRGHGQSEAGQAPYGFDQLTDDVLALYDALDIDKADFMGISLGGMTGLALAMRAPERVGKLICCDARASAPEPYKAIWDGNIAKLHKVGVAGLVESTLERWFTPEFMANPKNTETLTQVHSMFNATSATGYEGAARALQSLDLLDGLSSLKCQTLFIVGEADMPAPVAVMQDMADRTPNGVLKVLSNAAHLSNMEQPDAFNTEIRNFLNL